MSRIKSLLFYAALLGGLLGFAQGSAFAETANAVIGGNLQPPPKALAPPQPAAALGSAPAVLRGPEQRVALVIGNSRYEHAPQLANPDNDAQSIAQFLNSAGFEVIEATDLTQNGMIKAVQEFSAKLASRGPNTVAMIYYAGHGVQLDGENYLIPVDAKISSPADLVNNSVRLVDIMATLEAIPSRMRIVVLDACRNNPFPGIQDAGRGLAIVDAPNGSIVGYSTAPGTEALDGDGAHSPYASAFLKVARQPDLPIEQLFKRVRLAVDHATDGQQTPWESSSLTSDFYFFGDTAVAATRPPAHGPVVQMASNLPSRSARQAYDFVLSEDSPEYYQEFIQLFPHDPLCDRIRYLLANLLEAAAWHKVVLANSPLAYKAFYENHAKSPYAQAALKLASHPKMLPPMHPAHLLLPQHPTSTIFGKHPTDPKLSSGKIVMFPAPTIPGIGKGSGKIVTLPVKRVSKTLTINKPVTVRQSNNNRGKSPLAGLPMKRQRFHTTGQDHPPTRFAPNRLKPTRLNANPPRRPLQPIFAPNRTTGANRFTPHFAMSSGRRAFMR